MLSLTACAACSSPVRLQNCLSFTSLLLLLLPLPGVLLRLLHRGVSNLRRAAGLLTSLRLAAAHFNMSIAP